MIKNLNLAVLKWVLYTSLFAACCAVGLCMATEKIMLGHTPSLWSALHLFVAANTMVIYNLHYYIKRLPVGVSDRADWSRKNAWVHPLIMLLAMLISGICLFFLNWAVIAVSIGLGVLSLGYSLPILPFKQKKRLKDWGILKLVLLSLVWASVTVLMPMFYWGKHFVNFEVEFLLRFFFMLPLCAAFDIRDMETDNQNKIYTLPNAIGLKNTYRLIDFFLLTFGILAVIQYYRYPIGWRLISGIIILIITKAIIKLSKNSKSDIFYLLFIDGIMLLYAFMILLA